VTARAGLFRTVIAIVGLVALGVACSFLSVWQFRRAAESRSVSARFAAAAEEPPLDDPPDELTDALRFRRLAVAGRYVPEPQFLLDDRVHDGVAGYEVLTAFRLADGRTLLVDRGWIEANPDRRVLPDVTVGGAERTVLGQVDRLPRAGLRLGTSAPEEAAPGVVVVVYPTAEELGVLLHARPLDYVLALDADEPDSFVRDSRPPVLTPERHLAYAGQWLLFALGAVGAAVAIARGARAGRAARRTP
jgi:surfeit locus 1 family protein